MGKLIVIEGTDCSGKETQSKILVDKLNEEGIKAIRLQNPFYESATGKIIAACYLGKKDYCEEILNNNRMGLFEEGATNVDSITASLYYAADRRYNLPILNDAIMNNDIVVLDRYIYSNMAHQGGKCLDIADRRELFHKLEMLEFDICELPRPDLVIFLHVPYEVALELKKNRSESLDQHELDKNHLIHAENTYLELANIYKFDIISCVSNNKIRSIDDINKDIHKRVKKLVK